MDPQPCPGAATPLGPQPPAAQRPHSSHERPDKMAATGGGNVAGVACGTLTDEWSPEEERILVEELAKVPATMAPTERYVMVASKLPRKTTRQTALRAVQLARKDGGKRRKCGDEDSTSKRQCREPSSRAAVSGSRASAEGGGGGGGAPAPPQLGGLAPLGGCLPPVGPISEANKGLGAAVSQLLGDNYAVLNQIKDNMGACRVAENNELLSRFRDNLAAIIDHMEGMKGVMGKMPQLSVSVDNKLADAVLTKSPPNTPFSAFPGMGPLGLPMGGAPASPMPPMPFFPGFMSCMMPGGLPVNLPGGMPSMSVAPAPSLPTGINVPSSSEMGQGNAMRMNPFMPSGMLGMLPGNPQMGGLMMNPLAASLQSGQQGLGMGGQGLPPLTRMASAPGSLCLPNQNSSVGISGLPTSGAWNAANGQWAGKAAASNWEVANGLPRPGVEPGVNPSAARLAVGASDMVAGAAPLAHQGLQGGLLNAGGKAPGVVQGATG